MRAADSRRRSSRSALARPGCRHARDGGERSLARATGHEVPRRLCPRVGWHRVARDRAGCRLDGSSRPRIRCRGPRAMDERGPGRARRAVWTQGPDRAGVRCRPRDVGSGPRIHGRCVAAPATAQSDTLCRPAVAGRRVHHVRSRSAGVGARRTRTAGRWSASMNEPFVDLIDLASERLGGVAVAANDEFFASKDHLVAADPPVWREGEYTDRGKWMDGWETRRRRDVLPGEPAFDQAHDWCIVRLGARGIVHGVDVETTHFKGNFPETCMLETCVMPGAPGTLTLDDLDRAGWHGALERSILRGDSHNLFDIAGAPATHVRLNIFPDGGVARLRVYGDVVSDWDALRREGEIDLSSTLHGGRVVGCSDMFFGSRHNLIMPGQARTIAEGWETKRRRTPGHDWTVIRLGAAGTIVRAAIDWRPLLPRTALTPDRRHTFDVPAAPAITHVRFNIFPDGGVGRLRLFG